MKNSIYFILILLCLISCKMEKDVKSPMLDLLVGTYTNGNSEGIYLIQFNPEDGSLGDPKLVADTENPSYITLNDGGEYLYAVNELEEGGITSFLWDKNKAELTKVQEVSSMGSYPCYVAVDNGKLSVANYGSGNSLVVLVNKGRFSDETTLFQHQGTLGSDEDRQEGPHAHYADFGDGYVYTIDLGIDEVMAIPNDEQQGLGEMRTALKLEPGDGSRHLDFHPLLPLVAIVNELSNTVVSARIDEETGMLEAMDRISILPDDFEGTSYAADIHFSPDGQFLYASNRGHHSIAIISFSEDGSMKLLGTESTGGEWPRNFTLTPDGNWLLVANEHTSNIVVFERDRNTGLITFTGKEVQVSNPTCLLFN